MYKRQGLYTHKIPIDLITFADTGAEHPHTYQSVSYTHLDVYKRQGYIWYEAPAEEMNFITLLELINASEAREDDEEYRCV